MIKAVIFDCFGVLVQESLNGFCEVYFANRPDAVDEVRRIDRLSCDGQATWDDVVDVLVRLSGMERSEVVRLLDENPKDEQLISYISETLRGYYKIGLLSNAAGNWLGELLGETSLALFDQTILSYECGVSKPDAEIYRIAAHRLGVSPSECLFIDDNEQYCDGARAVGMQALRYRSFSEFQQAVGAFLR